VSLRTMSLRNLRLCLAHHLRWLGTQNTCWQCAGSEDLRCYLAVLIGNDLTDATLSVYRWALATLYRWAHRNNHRADDPVSKLASMRWRPRSLRWVPSREQVDRILHAPDVRTALGVRDRCILELLYATGMRASELLRLQAWQIAPKQRCLKIIGKGERERLVIYGESAADWLGRYLHEARPRLIEQVAGCGKGSPNLFVHPTPKLAMNYLNLWRMVRRYAQCAGLPLMTPHVFRHAFATHCKDAGMDLITLQALLGHASVSTTTIYLRTSMAALRALLECHHPRGMGYVALRRGRNRSGNSTSGPVCIAQLNNG